MTKKLVLGFSIIILLLQLLFISYINYNDFVDLQIITSNSLISDQSVSLILRAGDVPQLYELLELIKIYPDITLLSKLYNFDNLVVWGLCGNCYLDNNANSLINGRFFAKDDFFKEDFKAVVSENILNSDNCYLDKNEKIYFKFNNNNYEVIGVISSNISNMLDNTVFVNLDSLNIEFLNKFIIDGTDNEVIDNAVNSIIQEYNVDIISENNNFVERYIFNDVDKHILSIFMVIFISILIITLSMFILHYYSEEIKVKRIIGISFKRILSDLLKNIITLTLINTAFFVTVYTIIYYKVLQEIHLCFYFSHVIIFSCIILIIISWIIYLYMLISNNFFYRNGVK
ncbi:ABC transporter permease [Sedimentibacter sp. zth1]|uniref:ABC transporter permease n=1 Tax=Sedimentibacter sp. zth1 TaxID=2816908 RepID=UPI001A918E8A|nr:ABC transporter permease [Sedimentibacter sp. zth1]QSX05743.1 ABC transporter permease [Sedimentibacter sp. zth1]